MKLLANTGAESLSPRAVVIPARGVSRFPAPESTQASRKCSGGCLVSVSSRPPHCGGRHWGGSDISIPVMKSSWHCSSPLGIPIGNANGWGGGKDQSLGGNYASLPCLGFSIPLMGVRLFPHAPPFSQVFKVLQEPLGECCTPIAVAELKAASCCNGIAPYGAFQPRFSP